MEKKLNKHPVKMMSGLKKNEESGYFIKSDNGTQTFIRSTLSGTKSINDVPVTKYQTVMLIDDNSIDNFAHQQLISNHNFSKHAHAFSEALEALNFLIKLEIDQDTEENLFPEIIFLDIDMPMIDGFQFLPYFSKIVGDAKKKCKIVILTNSINPFDREKAKNSSFVMEYINKPLTKEALDKL